MTKKRSVGSRLLRGLGIFVGVVVLIVVVLLLNINSVVKKAVNVGGPMMLGVPVKVEKVSISLLSGTFDLKKFYVGNPGNYSTNKPLFAVDNVYVSMDMKSLTKDTIAIRTIKIDSPQVNYEVKGGKSNFDVLMENLGEAEKKKKDKPGKDKPDKKVTIDEFELNGAKVSYTSPLTLGATIPLPIPSLHLRDIGKSKGGASFAEATMEILNGLGNVIANAAKAAGDIAKDAAKAVGEGAKAVGEGVKDAAKAAGEGVKDAAKAIKKLF